MLMFVDSGWDLTLVLCGLGAIFLISLFGFSMMILFTDEWDSFLYLINSKKESILKWLRKCAWRWGINLKPDSSHAVSSNEVKACCLVFIKGDSCGGYSGRLFRSYRYLQGGIGDGGLHFCGWWSCSVLQVNPSRRSMVVRLRLINKGGYLESEWFIKRNFGGAHVSMKNKGFSFSMVRLSLFCLLSEFLRSRRIRETFIFLSQSAYVIRPGFKSKVITSKEGWKYSITLTDEYCIVTPIGRGALDALLKGS